MTISFVLLTLRERLLLRHQFTRLYKEYSRGLRTQPCGAPVLRMIVEEVLWPILTDCGLRVRMFRIQSQREVPRPRPQSLEMSFVGIMVLKAEL